METTIAVALITVIGGVIVALIQVGRSENKTDHAAVVSGIARIETKIDGHLTDHARASIKAE